MDATTRRPPSASATAGDPHPWRRRLYLALLVWMVLSFMLGGIAKFYWGDSFFGDPYAVKFDEWGYPSWFRFPVGAGELVAAGLLVSPRWRFLGAAALLFITAGATLTHLINHDPFSVSWAAPTHMVLSAVVAYATKPAEIRALITPSPPTQSRAG